jgi:hypothetical protein
MYIYISSSYFLHFTIGPISMAHLRTTPWPTPVEDHCGHILIVQGPILRALYLLYRAPYSGPYTYCTGPHTPDLILIVQGPILRTLYLLYRGPYSGPYTYCTGPHTLGLILIVQGPILRALYLLYRDPYGFEYIM